MTAEGLVTALGLPASSRLNKRVPKSLLVENGAPTPADRRHVNESVESLVWAAVLKPGIVGVPAFRDDIREYLEIVVLHLTLRPGTGAAAARLTELVHRAVPYPVILSVDNSEGITISAAHKRWSQGEAGKPVLDGEVMTVSWGPECGVLALSGLSHASMYTLYDGWLDAIAAIRASRITGDLRVAGSAEQSADRRVALGEWEQVEREIAQVRNAARRETQMARQVELNMKLKTLEAQQAAVRARLR